MIDSKGIVHSRLFPTKSAESGKVVSVLKMPILLVSLEGAVRSFLESRKQTYIP